jgi:hypothetical protein
MTYGEWTTRMKAQAAAEYFAASSPSCLVAWAEETKKIKQQNEELRKANEEAIERIERLEAQLSSVRWA